MTSTDQKQALFQVVDALRAAESLLYEASQQVSDPDLMMRMTIEHHHIDSWLSQVLHAQALSDDALFAQAVTSLQQGSDALTAEEKAIQKVVGDVAIAAKIVGYLAQAAKVIAAL